jgi:outer membrane protein OmpA-like peptidoglycan-associated protein
LAIAAVGYAWNTWNAKIEFDKKIIQIESNSQLQKQQDDLARKKLEVQKELRESALQAQRLADANIRAKEEAAKAAAARTIKETPSQRQPAVIEPQQNRSAIRGVQVLDGAWYSSEWKYGYVLKNGVGTATSTNSQNFQVGQNIIQLRATSDTTFVGQQVYMDGKFYNINVTLRPDGHLYFEGDRNVSWVMRRVVDKVSVNAELYFSLDQANISVEGQKLLDNVVSLAAKILLESIVIQGFSASIGSSDESRNLSLRRASAVKSYLVSRGVKPENIYISGKGAQNPVGDNNTPAGRAMNNRVFIEIIGSRR